MSSSPRIALLMTGNELMTGDIVDSNSARLADWLLEYGLLIASKTTVGDDLDVLKQQIVRLARDADVLIVNGGLGPTRDDLTASALALALDVELSEHPDALAHLQEWCRSRGFELNAANRKQALLPAGVDVIPNDIGSAVGFKTVLEGCQIYCTPGVPSEFERMMRKYVGPGLLPESTDKPFFYRRRLRIFGMGEASLQQRIQDGMAEWPETVELGFRASLPLLECKLQIARASDLPQLEACEQSLRELFGAHVVGDDERSLAEHVVAELQSRHKTFTCAESCTGGQIAAEITKVAGASEVFEAGIVSYSNRIKEKVLGVSSDVLARHGAVSREIVLQMLEGALKLSDADLGVAVSGVAGPGGGSEEKPVGTVWVAWGSSEAQQAREFFFPGSRGRFQTLVTALALDLVRRQLLDCEEEPVYFRERARTRSVS